MPSGTRRRVDAIGWAWQADAIGTGWSGTAASTSTGPARIVFSIPRSARAGHTRSSLALVFALAFVWFWPTLHHGLRSDDYLVCYYTDRLTGTVRWDRVFAEFGRAWFGTGELYRPLISLSYAVEHWLWPGPTAAHVVNVLFVAMTAVATGATAALLAPRRPALAAAIAGAAIVLHPATVETAAWHAARVTNLQMAMGSAATWYYARHLARGRRAWPALACFALALASKEAAVTLPATLLAIDLLLRRGDRLRERARRLAPFGLLLVAYLAMRLALLGRIASADPFAVANLANVAIRTLQLVAPPDGDGAVVSWPLLVLGVALLPLARQFRLALLLVPAWCFVVLVPTQHLVADPAVLHGRFVFDAVPCLAMVLALAVAAPPRRAVAIGAGAAIVAWLATLGVPSRNWLARYEREDRVVRASTKAVQDAAATASPGRPFAFSGLPTLPIFHQRLWGVLGLQPFAARDLTVIGLPELLAPDPQAPEFLFDAAPVHAVLAAGGNVATLHAQTMLFMRLTPPRPLALTMTAGTVPGDLLAPTNGPDFAVAAIEVRLPAPARTLRWRFLDDMPAQLEFGTVTQAVHGAVTWIDATHALPPVMVQCAGLPFRGLHLEVDGSAPPAGTTVVVHATLATRALTVRSAGRERSRAELLGLSESPPFQQPARLYLMLPTGVRHQDVPATGAAMSPALRQHLEWALDVYAPLTVHWFWQGAPDAGAAPWRSEVDWATAR